MVSEAPPFWWQKAGWQAWLLSPFSLLYGKVAGRRMRKMGIKYSRFHPQANEVKMRFINVRSLRDWTNVLDDFYAHEGPGVWPDPRAADEVNSDLQTCET